MVREGLFPLGGFGRHYEKAADPPLWPGVPGTGEGYGFSGDHHSVRDVLHQHPASTGFGPDSTACGREGGQLPHRHRGRPLYLQSGAHCGLF